VVSFNSDGSKVVTAGSDGTVRIWDAATGLETRPPAMSGKSIQSAALSPDGVLVATTDYDGRTEIWETANGRPRFTLPEKTSGIAGTSFGTDRRTVISLHGDKARLWNSADGSLRTSVTAPASMGWQRAAMSRDGRLLALVSGDERTASGEEDPLVVDIGAGTKRVLQGSGAPVYSVAFSPDSRRVITAGEAATLRLWDLVTGTFIDLEAGGHTDRILCANFSPDGKTVITTSRDTSAKLWDIDTGRMTVDLLGHDDAVISGFFSPDGMLAVTVGADRTIRLCDVASGRQLAMYGGFPGQEPAAAFTNRGSSLVAVADGFVRSFDFAASGGVKDLLPLARRRITRSLLPEERERYLHEAARR